MFDSIQKAIDYLKESVSALWNAESVLSTRLREIDALKIHAQKVNDQPALGKLIVLESQTRQLQQERASLAARINPFREYFGSSTLGALPLMLIPLGIGLAGTIYVFFQKMQNDGKTLDMIKAGILKPSEAAALMGGGFAGLTGNIGTILMVAVAGYALFLFGPTLARSFGGRK